MRAIWVIVRIAAVKAEMFDSSCFKYFCLEGHEPSWCLYWFETEAGITILATTVSNPYCFSSYGLLAVTGYWALPLKIKKGLSPNHVAIA
jgi:hypothetical protein